MIGNKCARDSCDELVGAVGFTFKGNLLRIYCSEACRNSSMDRKAEDFGEAGVTRKYCDRSGCQNRISLRWKGRYGEYCSNDCMKLAERSAEGKTMTDETTTTEAPAAEKPITAGKTPKKSGKKAAAKAPAKKASAPKKVAAKASSNGSLSKEKTIKVIGSDHEFRGNRGERVSILLKMDGKTVQDFRDALSKKKLGGPEYGDYVGSTLRAAIEAKLVSVK